MNVADVQNNGDHSSFQLMEPVIVGSRLPGLADALRRRLPRKSNVVVIEGADAGAEQLVEQAVRIGPSVLLLADANIDEVAALDMPDGLDFGGVVRILVVGRGGEDRAQVLLRLGCMGLLEEGAPPKLVAKAVLALIRGEMWFSRRVLTAALRDLLHSSRSPELTAREREILRLISAGHKNRAIATELCISYETVRWHIRRLNAKLQGRERVLSAGAPADSAGLKPAPEEPIGAVRRPARPKTV